MPSFSRCLSSSCSQNGSFGFRVTLQQDAKALHQSSRSTLPFGPTTRLIGSSLAIGSFTAQLEPCDASRYILFPSNRHSDRLRAASARSCCLDACSDVQKYMIAGGSAYTEVSSVGEPDNAIKADRIHVARWDVGLASSLITMHHF